MAEILIKGMEMPTRCGKCDLRTYCRNKEGNMATVCSRLKREIPSLNLDEVRMADCPLVELPEHGRLGDLDKTRKQIEDSIETVAKSKGFVDGGELWKIVNKCFDEAPTVLETSE